MQTHQELIDQARVRFEQKDFAGAEELYRSLVERNSSSAELRVMLGISHFAQGNHSAALAELETATRLDDDRAEIWFHLARVHRAAGNRKKAREAIGRCIERDPNHVLGRVESGHLALVENNPNGAEQAYRTALRADPESVPALIALGELLFSQGQLDEPHRLASAAIKLRPAETGAQLLMARVFRAQGHYSFAEQALLNVIEHNSGQDELWLELAWLLHDAKRPADALEVLRTISPGTSSAEISLLRALGQGAEAHRRLEVEYASQKGMSTDARIALAELRVLSGNFSGAETLSQTLAEERPEAHQFIEALIAEQRGQTDRAVELARGLFASQDANWQRQMRLLVGRLSVASSDVDGCRAALETLVEKHNDPVAHSLLAQALDRDGQTQQAALHLARAGWRDAVIVNELGRLMPEELVRDVLALDKADWPLLASEPSNQRIVHLLGWPAGARPAVLAALTAHPGVKAMSKGDLQRRRDILQLPVAPGKLLTWQPMQLERIRRRYLDAAGDDGQALLLEIAGLETVALPALARCLPGSKVLIVNEDLRDLELAWRMAGFRNAASMVALWQQERELVQHLRTFLPLEFILIDRARLQADPDTALARLATRLDLDEAAAAEMAAAAGTELDALRPTGAWADYSNRLLSADVPG